MTPLALEQRQHPPRDADDTNDAPIKDSLVPSRARESLVRAKMLITESILAISGAAAPRSRDSRHSRRLSKRSRESVQNVRASRERKNEREMSREVLLFVSLPRACSIVTAESL